MLQDPIMEKNKSRLIQSSSKGIVTDSKKNQDVASGKFWPKSGRCRDPSNNGQPKNESNRKPAPQRNKFVDKRPKPKGNYYSGTVGGKENAGLEKEDPEFGSVFDKGSKKQSLNHLLNFHYTPRGDNGGNSSGTTIRYGHSHGNNRWLSTHKHKYNKEQFLQANCQFIVSTHGDYTAYLNNPDALVDWDLIEQIHVQVSEFPSCPICLYSPVAAKMTRCGHVYCWSCLLHYLALSEKSWHKCPICYEAIHKNDLKSVVAMPHNAFNVGEYIKFRLMRREKGSFTAIPVEENRAKRDMLLNINEKNVDTVYSKLLLADSSEVLSIVDRERKELNLQLNDEENGPEKCFIEQAIDLLDERERIILSKLKKIERIGRTSLNDNDNTIETQHFINDCTTEYCVNPFDNNSNNNRQRFESISSEDLNSNISLNVNGEKTLHLSYVGDTSELSTVKNYYFYQAADGQHIYMHALNIRMLEHTYGSLENCPKILNGRILEKEGGSMTEELRKRLRYLQHLPITCQFEVAEIHIQPPVICKETLDLFQEQIETRRKRRQRRTREEKRREKRITEEENRKMGKYPEANINFESFHQFPECGLEEMPPIPSSSASNFASEISSSAIPEETNGGPSFAKMLTTGKAKQTSWPILSKAKQEEPRPKLINVTGSRQVTTTRRNSDSEPDAEDYVPIPDFNQSFSDAFALALEKSTVGIQNDGVGAPSRGKKKKNKKKILFTTSVRFPEK